MSEQGGRQRQCEPVVHLLFFTVLVITTKVQNLSILCLMFKLSDVDFYVYHFGVFYSIDSLRMCLIHKRFQSVMSFLSTILH